MMHDWKGMPGENRWRPGSGLLLGKDSPNRILISGTELALR